MDIGGHYLNYGYHEETSVRPDELSLNDLARAQARFAELIFEQVADIRGPILDVGCGMGGLLDLMHARCLDATGLTPDRLKTGPSTTTLWEKQGQEVGVFAQSIKTCQYRVRIAPP